MTDINELSEREREILHLVATGASNKEIAKALYISTNTVKVHLRNIFGKIGVSSRTEAAMYAVSAGLVEPVTSKSENGFTVVSGSDINVGKIDSQGLIQNGVLHILVNNTWMILILFGVLLSLGLLVFVVITGTRPTTFASNGVTPPVATPRWQNKAVLPIARSGLAVTSYEGQIYAIGGESAEGVTNLNERYDPSTNRWTKLSSKPSSVTDIDAAVIGGLIYVPGGRLSSGRPTDKLEVYDPREAKWDRRASLPKPVSAYALTAFEGRLYLFGGWDGERYVSDVFEYDPASDVWIKRTDMPSPRGYAGAAVAGGKIYVLGGFDGERALAVNEVYLPEVDAQSGKAWDQRTPLPIGIYAMGVSSVADNIYLIGGESSDPDQIFTSIVYVPQADEWQLLDDPEFELGRNLNSVSLGTDIFAIGGEKDNAPTNQNLSFQVMYRTSIPIIVK